MRHWRTSPRQKPQILAMLGDTYEALGNYAKAADNWQRALQLNRQQTRERGRRANARIHARLRSGPDRNRQISEAEEILAKAVAGSATHLWIRTYRNPVCDQQSGDCARSTGRLNEAEPLFKQNWETRSRVFGSNHHKDTLQALVNYASVLMRKGDYAAADPLFRAAIEGFRSQGLGDTPVALNSENAWASNLIYQRKLDEAKQLVGGDHRT